ncbi:flagellar biosynthetic protein FliO [Paenibacillus sp. Marseille-Q4541]|uniref:flagellar biosynthetic protein FliO n=1 Tax=Paenibacillus sp. Marseille-Q4541 TaxID=2831522 RepID=UPI001BADD5E3|nr:flagellar biosynthetic protein FliO [Paenibacillus sp. Marseille-Q4541]
MTDSGRTDSLGSSYFGTMFTVIFVLIIIVVCIVLLIRFLGRKNQSFFQKRTMRVIGGVGLGPSKSLQIVEVGSKLYILGIGDDVHMIDTLSDPEEIRALIVQFEQEGTSEPSLAKLITGVKNQLLKNKNKAESYDIEEASFGELFQKKLREMPDRKDQMESWLAEEETRERSRDS